MEQVDLTVVLGIRPDVIRASLVLKKLKSLTGTKTRFVWSGQHYSDNLKDVFFRELNIPKPDREFTVVGDNDAEISTQIQNNLYREFLEFRPKAAVFLGDTNTVLGCISAAQQNIPIVHIEGCMRSYDWRMPEEKCRTVIDSLSDVIYTYFHEYKLQGVAEGLNPKRIVVIQNLIVDVLEEYFFSNLEEYMQIASSFLREHGITGNFYLATTHRRENVEDEVSLVKILSLFKETNYPVIFPASYRTQKAISRFGVNLPRNVLMIDPIGYKEILALMSQARAVITDSGTIVEETAIIGTPSIQMRRSTERPQTYDCRSSVKFDPLATSPYEALMKLEKIIGTEWNHNLGDGKASERLVSDLMTRVKTENLGTHKPGDYHVPTERSFQEDGLK